MAQELASIFRFVESPIDYIVFKGLSNKGKIEQCFSLKHSAAELDEREESARNAIEDKRIKWITHVLKIFEEIDTILGQEVKKSLTSQKIPSQ